MQVISNYWLSQLLDFIDCFDDGTDEEDYDHINWNIIVGNLLNMYLIVMEGENGAIDADDSSCHGYYIIKMSSSTYTLQTELSIYGQVISSGEMIR